MNRRTISICLVLGLLLVALLSVVLFPHIAANAQVASTATLTATPTASTGPDLILTGISWTRTNPGLYPATFTFKAVIQNVGNVASPAGVIHDVRIDLMGDSAGQVMSTSWTQSIAPGGSATVPGDTSWSTNVLHNYTVLGSVDVGARIVEMNENNNSYTAPKQLILEPTPLPFTRTPTSTRTFTPIPGSLPDLTVLSIVEFAYTDPTSTPNAQGCWPSGPYGRIGLRVSIQNIGAADAGAFILDLNGLQKSISGLAASQTLAVDFTGMMLTRTRTATADITGLVAESDETNNVYTLALSAATPPRTGTVPPQICLTRTPTPTGGVSLTPTSTRNTPTKTPTWRTITPLPSTPTRTPTRGTSTPTRTFTPTLTPTACGGSCGCTPVTATITAPFTYDGAGAFCWQSSNLGSYINSWNLVSLMVNYVNETNVYVASGSYPAKVNGYWYIWYTSAVTYGHFEAK
jgi:hypothetical protein